MNAENTDRKYPIIEIFHSIQGEGANIGIPATFIRFAGCNLRCSWCDTKYSWEIKPEYYKLIEEIVSEVKYPTVILTGGEPTLYNLKPLVIAIKKHIEEVLGKDPFICIETNGTMPIPDDIGIDWITCSPKPDAKYEIACNPNELKYVVDDNFAPDVIPRKYHNEISIWLQPNGEDMMNSAKKAIKMVMEHEYLRLGVQLHKIFNIK